MVDLTSDLSSSQKIFDQLITINERAFVSGYFDVAYYALESALSCAEGFTSDQPLLTVSNLAKNQLALIDQYHPEYIHSTLSASKRQQESIFFELACSAEKKMISRKVDRELSQLKVDYLL